MSFFHVSLLKWKFKWPSWFWVHSHLKCFEHWATHWSSKWISLELFRKEGWEGTSRHEEKYQSKKGKRVTEILHFIFGSIFIFEKYMLTEMKRCIHWLFVYQEELGGTQLYKKETIKFYWIENMGTQGYTWCPDWICTLYYYQSCWQFFYAL